MSPPRKRIRSIAESDDVTEDCEEKLPVLTVDALRSIFKFFHGWDLLPLRLVSRTWNRVIVHTHAHWRIHPTLVPDSWAKLTSFRAYVKHMFLFDARAYPKVRLFLLRHPEIFIYVCGLLLGRHMITRPSVTPDEITVANYRLTKTGLYYNGQWTDVYTFLDAYRISIL